MKIKRKISWGRIFAAFLITILIFGLGIFMGLLFDYQRVQWSERESKQQKIDYESLQWQYLFLTSTEDKEQMCILLKTSLDKSIVDLGESLDKIQSYKEQSQINDIDYKLIERTYLIDNLKYWLLATKTKKECGANYVTILYFYSDKCEICPDQGIILTYFKKKYDDNVLIFPINTDMEKDESSMKVLTQLYNVSVVPSIVVEDQKYEGVISTEQLGKIICNEFQDKTICLE